MLSRWYRLHAATLVSMSTATGSTMCSIRFTTSPCWPTEYFPCTYSTSTPSCSWSTSTTKSCSSNAKKKSGMEKPKYENVVAAWSNVEYCRTALTTPMRSASTTDSTSAVPTSNKEFHVASPTMSTTGRWVRNESPQSPCTKSPSHPTYWSGRDSSRWYSRSRLRNVTC